MKYIKILLTAILACGVLSACGKTIDVQPDAQSETETQTEAQAESAPDTDTAEPSADRLAQDFAAIWADKWSQLQNDGIISSGEGRGFLADLDSDGSKELVFVYDSYLNYNAVVYRLSDTVEELGSFTVSQTTPELAFDLYQNPQTTVLHHKAERTHAADENGKETEETFIRLQGGKLIQDSLYFTEYGGEETYYDSMEAGAKEITKEDYELLRLGMLGSSTPTETITFAPEEFVDVTDTEKLWEYIKTVFQGL